MSKYLHELLDKIVTYLNRIYEFDLRIVEYNGQTYIRDWAWGCNEQGEDEYVLLTLDDFARDYSGSCAFDTFLSKAEQSIAQTNFKIT